MSAIVDIFDLPDLAGAVCANRDPELWFSDHQANVARAVTFCRQCPVTARCLSAALDRREVVGVWGGVDFDTRHRFDVSGDLARPGCRHRPCGVALSRERLEGKYTYCSEECWAAAKQERETARRARRKRVAA